MEKETESNIYSRVGLAGKLRVSLPTVDAWVRAGCPYKKRGGRGKEWEFDLADVADWREEHARQVAAGEKDNAEEIKRKTLAIDLETKSFELAEKKKLVAPIEEMSRMMVHVFAGVRAGIRNLPTRCASQLVGENDPRKIKSILMNEIDILLEELSSADLTDGFSVTDDVDD